MHKYKATLLFGFGHEFKSKHHLSKMEVMTVPNASYVHFEDAGVVLDLNQVKKMEIDGVNYNLKAYKI